jgi:hypothetical protein
MNCIRFINKYNFAYQMKKAFAAILAILYFVTTTGATIDLFSCKGKMVESSMAKSEASICGMCKMEKKAQEQTGCCKHEQKFVKIVNDQNISDASFHIQKPVSIISSDVFFEINNFNFTSKAAEYSVTNSPQRSSSITIYERNCTFLI